MTNIRVPVQKRSIEKRNKIIKMGFELMCDNGYYNTNTNDIAKYAGVSTGIIYQYFNDKKDIFIEGIKNYSDNIMFPILNLLNDTKIDVYSLDSILSNMLDIFIKNHTLSKKAHEEMIALSHLDSDIAHIFYTKEFNTTDKIVLVLSNNNIEMENMKEKVHIIVGIVENYCHEVVYHKHEKMNYEVMRQEVINIIKSILKA